MSIEVKDILDKVLRQRFTERVPAEFLHKLSPIGGYIYLAGNSLNSEPPNDLDFYFPTEDAWGKAIELLREDKEYPLVWRSKNAYTYIYAGRMIQLCAHHKPELAELCQSFDFSHVQIGVCYDLTNSIITETYASDAYLEWKLTSQVKYTGTEYPLSSLIRTEKYYTRGLMNKSEYKKIILLTLADIINRGFRDYGDFKDQLDAIDLLIDNSGAEARHLYDVCCQRNLVCEKDKPENEEEEEEWMNL